MAKQGFHSTYDFGTQSVRLMQGESEVARWVVPPGTFDGRRDGPTQWQIDRFTADKLRSVIEFVERMMEE